MVRLIKMCIEGDNVPGRLGYTIEGAEWLKSPNSTHSGPGELSGVALVANVDIGVALGAKVEDLEPRVASKALRGTPVGPNGKTANNVLLEKERIQLLFVRQKSVALSIRPDIGSCDSRRR